MRRLYVIVLVQIFLSSYAIADTKLECAGEQGERKLLREAPSGASRISQHILEIKHTRGVKRFTDKPPHEELSGEHWEYCGYNENVKLHLIHHQTEGSFSGAILFEETGKVLSAGHTVIVSPDRQKFLAIVQEDGMDGENWTLFEISGKKLWGGYAGVLWRISGNNYDSIYAQFENPYFSEDQNVSAKVVCSNQLNKGVVTLKKIGDKWKWLPEIKC